MEQKVNDEPELETLCCFTEVPMAEMFQEMV